MTEIENNKLLKLVESSNKKSLLRVVSTQRVRRRVWRDNLKGTTLATSTKAFYKIGSVRCGK